MGTRFLTGLTTHAHRCPHAANRVPGLPGPGVALECPRATGRGDHSGASATCSQKVGEEPDPPCMTIPAPATRGQGSIHTRDTYSAKLTACHHFLPGPCSPNLSLHNHPHPIRSPTTEPTERQTVGLGEAYCLPCPTTTTCIPTPHPPSSHGHHYPIGLKKFHQAVMEVLMLILKQLCCLLRGLTKGRSGILISFTMFVQYQN